MLVEHALCEQMPVIKLVARLKTGARQLVDISFAASALPILALPSQLGAPSNTHTTPSPTKLLSSPSVSSSSVSAQQSPVSGKSEQSSEHFDSAHSTPLLSISTVYVLQSPSDHTSTSATSASSVSTSQSASSSPATSPLPSSARQLQNGIDDTHSLSRSLLPLPVTANSAGQLPPARNRAYSHSHTQLPTTKQTPQSLISPFALAPPGSADPNVHTGLVAAHLIRHCMRCLPSLQPLAFALKQLLVEHGLNDSYTGGLSSYCLVLMAVTFLQAYNHNPKQGAAHKARVDSRRTSLPARSIAASGGSRSFTDLTTAKASSEHSEHSHAPLSPMHTHNTRSDTHDTLSVPLAKFRRTSLDTNTLFGTTTTQATQNGVVVERDFGQLLMAFLDFFGRRFNYHTTGISLTPQIPSPG